MAKAPYSIVVRPDAKAQMEALKTYEHRRVVDAIKANLLFEPKRETRNRSELLGGLAVGFEFQPPLWELRVGELRVFYDVSEEARSVYIRAVLRKPPGKTTQEIVR